VVIHESERAESRQMNTSRDPLAATENCDVRRRVNREGDALASARESLKRERCPGDSVRLDVAH